MAPPPPPRPALFHLFRRAPPARGLCGAVIRHVAAGAQRPAALVASGAPGGRHVADQREERVMMVGEPRGAGVLEREEATLVRRVFRLTDRAAGQLMTPRTTIA